MEGSGGKRRGREGGEGRGERGRRRGGEESEGKGGGGKMVRRLVDTVIQEGAHVLNGGCYGVLLTEFT